MYTEEGMYFPPQKPHCRYIIPPTLWLQDEEGEENSFHNMSKAFSAIMGRLSIIRIKLKELYSLRVRVMYCRKAEGEKVGSTGSRVWKLEVSYPIGHPSIKQSIVVNQ
jgi:hypothetical protein